MTVLFVCLRHLLTTPDCLKALNICLGGSTQVSGKTSTLVKIPSALPHPIPPSAIEIYLEINLKLIGWEKGWESLARRVSDLSKITIRVVLHFSTIFSLVHLHNFLSKLTPSDYVLPENTRFRRQLAM